MGRGHVVCIDHGTAAPLLLCMVRVRRLSVDVPPCIWSVCCECECVSPMCGLRDVLGSRQHAVWVFLSMPSSATCTHRLFQSLPGTGDEAISRSFCARCLVAGCAGSLGLSASAVCALPHMHDILVSNALRDGECYVQGALSPCPSTAQARVQPTKATHARHPEPSVLGSFFPCTCSHS